MVSKRVIFGAFLLLVSSNFGAFLIKQLFHSRLLDMRLVIADFFLTEEVLSPNGLCLPDNLTFQRALSTFHAHHVSLVSYMFHQRFQEA